MFQVSAVTFIVQCVGPTYMNRDAEYERVKHRCTGVQVYRCTGVQVYRCVQLPRCSKTYVVGPVKDSPEPLGLSMLAHRLRIGALNRLFIGVRGIYGLYTGCFIGVYRMFIGCL